VNSQQPTPNAELPSGPPEAPEGQSGQRQTGADDIDDRLLDFAARVVRLVEALPPSRVGNHVAGQLLRSGTSPMSNHAEAQGAESSDDFIHKMRICLKELRESHRWLVLARRIALVEPPSRLDALIAETDELVAIFVTSIQTALENRQARLKKADSQ
jgi:four helix bundle protein